MLELYIVIVLVIIYGVYTWWQSPVVVAPVESMNTHGVSCRDREFAGGPGYAATCSRGHHIPTTYHVDTAWNSDVNTSKNMNYAFSYWNGIKLASCDECPTPYVCKGCPKFTGAGAGIFDDPDKIRGINNEINIGEDEKAPSVHGEFFGASPLFGQPSVYTDGAPIGGTRTPIDDISPLASNAYEIARRAARPRPPRGSESIKADTMVGNNQPGNMLISPAPMGSAERMSISSHNEVYHDGEYNDGAWQSCGNGSGISGVSGDGLIGDHSMTPEDLFYRYSMDFASDSVSDLSRELRSGGNAKPRMANRSMYIDNTADNVNNGDGAALSLRKHARTAGCRRATASNAAKLLYTGVLGLHNPLPDMEQCEYLRSNGYVYQEPCSLTG